MGRALIEQHPEEIEAYQRALREYQARLPPTRALQPPRDALTPCALRTPGNEANRHPRTGLIHRPSSSPTLPRPSQVRPRRPCPGRALGIGPQRSPTVNNGRCPCPLPWIGSLGRRSESASQARGDRCGDRPAVPVELREPLLLADSAFQGSTLGDEQYASWMDATEETPGPVTRRLLELLPAGSGSVGGALVGLALGGPGGALAGAAVEPVLEQVVSETLARRRARGQRA
jgi:hypothetical protein